MNELINDFDKAIELLDESQQNAPPDDESARSSIAKIRECAVKLSKQAVEKQRKAFGNIFERARAEAEKKPEKKPTAAPVVDMNKID